LCFFLPVVYVKVQFKMRYWIKCNQLALWFVARAFLLITFSKRKVYLQTTSIQDDFGYVVVANHQSKLDPLVIFGALPLRTFYKLAPIRFMAHREFFEVYVYRIFLQMWGAFPNKEIRNFEYGLPLSAKILARFGTVSIYPEGTRLKAGQRVEPRRGVAVLAAEPHSRLIVCRVQWQKGWIGKVSVVISEPVDCSGQSAQRIMDRVYKLS
jgi:1-acyl-sn-glycerol-3-phosphate acyltransferase